jgi:pimeloyl-ACP methyl ester carboxylesterase
MRLPTPAAGACLAYAACLAGCAAETPRYRSFADVPYGFEVERTIHSRGARADVFFAEGSAEPAPPKTPLVLIHPWSTNMVIWKNVVPILARDRRVLLVDLPGHGKSGKPPGRYPPKRLAAGVLDVLDAAGVSRAVVVGNSLGGATAIQLALDAPDRVAGLVLVGAPGGTAIPDVSKRAAATGTRAREIATFSDPGWAFGWFVIARGWDPVTKKMVADTLALRGTPEWRAFARAASASFDAVLEWAPKVEDIRAPALVIQGGKDPIVPRYAGEALARRMPNAKLVLLEDCGHCPQLDCPDLLVEHVQAFLYEEWR